MSSIQYLGIVLCVLIPQFLLAGFTEALWRGENRVGEVTTQTLRTMTPHEGESFSDSELKPNAQLCDIGLSNAVDLLSRLETLTEQIEASVGTSLSSPIEYPDASSQRFDTAISAVKAEDIDTALDAVLNRVATNSKLGIHDANAILSLFNQLTPTSKLSFRARYSELEETGVFTGDTRISMLLDSQ